MRLEENLDSRPEKAQHLEFEQKRQRVGQISQINQREAKERECFKKYSTTEH